MTRPNQPSIVHHPSNPVKARIVAAGLRKWALAQASRISQPSLSNHLYGRRRSRPTQVAVWDAFCRLTGQRISLEDFWGELLANPNHEEEAA